MILQCLPAGGFSSGKSHFCSSCTSTPFCFTSLSLGTSFSFLFERFFFFDPLKKGKIADLL
jgi:hypothetical protein